MARQTVGDLALPMVDLATVDQDQANLIEQAMDETDARLVARLTQVLNTPGISDKDRKLLERNLKRLRERSLSPFPPE
ncbi:MAG: hypothetical protein WBE37_31075 [Bryobacteraceae bacterium]